ncbi:hypothetical protein ACNOYE_16955 [Nannocystaceae bacterium ST9]
MLRHQFTMARRSRPKRSGQPDLAAEFEVVNHTIETAARLASARLTELGVRHVLVGGLAVGAYAEPRATKDVDFLVGPEAWPTTGVIVSPIPGLPVQVGKVAVDTLLAPSEAPGIEEALARGIMSEGIPVAPAEVVLLMKLIADRARDRYDVAALLEVVNHESAREYVARYGPEYLDALANAIREYERQLRD